MCLALLTARSYSGHDMSASSAGIGGLILRRDGVTARHQDLMRRQGREDGQKAHRRSTKEGRVGGH